MHSIIRGIITVFLSVRATAAFFFFWTSLPACNNCPNFQTHSVVRRRQTVAFDVFFFFLVAHRSASHYAPAAAVGGAPGGKGEGGGGRGGGLRGGGDGLGGGGLGGDARLRRRAGVARARRGAAGLRHGVERFHVRREKKGSGGERSAPRVRRSAQRTSAARGRRGGRRPPPAPHPHPTWPSPRTQLFAVASLSRAGTARGCHPPPPPPPAATAAVLLGRGGAGGCVGGGAGAWAGRG